MDVVHIVGMCANELRRFFYGPMACLSVRPSFTYRGISLVSDLKF